MRTELEEERDAADLVKREERILVVLGNPPYNAFAGVSPDEEQGLVEPYKKDLNKPVAMGGWGIRKFNLDDLYIRFFRLAERRIAEMSGEGVISFISNFSYLGDPSFVVMRQRLLGEFDKFWFDCLNGDSRETGKLTPDDDPDPSVFSTDYNREGIRVGTAICVVARRHSRQGGSIVLYRDFWGAAKREQLQEMRREAMIGISADELRTRMIAYFDATIDWAEAVAEIGGLGKTTNSFDAKACRKKLVKAESFDVARIRRYSLYPFDCRWCYYTATTPLWNRPRPKLVAQQRNGEHFFIVRQFAERPHEWAAMTVASVLPDYHLLRPNAVAIPPYIDDSADGRQLTLASASLRANLSGAARAYLKAIGCPEPDENRQSGSTLSFYVDQWSTSRTAIGESWATDLRRGELFLKNGGKPTLLTVPR